MEEVVNTDDAIFIRLLEFFGYTKESGGHSYKGIYNNSEKNTKLVLSDSVGAVLSTETGDTLSNVSLDQDDKARSFKELAYLLYKGS